MQKDSATLLSLYRGQEIRHVMSDDEEGLSSARSEGFGAYDRKANEYPKRLYRGQDSILALSEDRELELLNQGWSAKLTVKPPVVSTFTIEAAAAAAPASTDRRIEALEKQFAEMREELRTAIEFMRPQLAADDKPAEPRRRGRPRKEVTAA